MLKFYGQSKRIFHVGDVLLTCCLIQKTNLLPVSRKIILPTAMPFGFRFPPSITWGTPFVCPAATLTRPHFAIMSKSQFGHRPLRLGCASSFWLSISAHRHCWAR